MQTQSKTHFNTTWLYLFLLAHLVLWTSVPFFVRFNLPLDSIEGTIWGHQLEWGYDKNPFLNGWLTAFAVYFSQPSGWAIYLFSQLSVVTAMWAVWQLAKKIVSPLYALLCVFLLETIQYYNLHAIDFNDNNLELSLWALTSYYFYTALQRNKIVAWILTGFFAGLGMLAKYYTAALLFSMFCFLFLDKRNRKFLTTFAPYAGLITFILLLLPHTIWLFQHDFITIDYVFKRTSSEPSWTNHFFFPAQFAWQQIQVFLPAVLFFSFLFIGKKPRLVAQHLSSFNRHFLFYAGLGPFLFTILLAILCGIKLRAGWGMPLMSLWGIILFAYFPPRLTITKMYSFTFAIFIFMGMLLTGYSISLRNADTPTSANFPGNEIAEMITQKWRQTFHVPLSYTAGSRWIGGNIEFYSKDHPAVFIECDTKKAPWINLDDLRQKGGVFVWNITENEQIPETVMKQFPRLQSMQILKFAWHRNKNNLPPIQIAVAFLPPEP